MKPLSSGLAAVLAEWALRGTDGWAGTPDAYLRLGKRALSLREPLVAYDILSEARRQFPKNVPLRHAFARALRDSGATARAIGELEEIRQEGLDDGETYSFLGSFFKTLWSEAASVDERQEYLRQAAKHYEHAYAAAAATDTADRVWPGINAAATALLLGEPDRARSIAAEVRDCCEEALAAVADGDANRYWYLATIAEALLILGQRDAAEEWYLRASREAGDRHADIGSTRRQARLLLAHMGEDPGRLDRCFPLPRVVTFAGHMIDQPGRETPRFPTTLEASVRDAIAGHLQELDAGFGFASAACGGDILFLECMIERGAETHVVLPCAVEEFRRKSVDIIPGADWGTRFDHVLSRAARVILASEQRSASSALIYDYGNELVAGLATIRARQLGTEMSLLAVWDGRPGDGPGGTASVMERWDRRGYNVRTIDVAAMMKESAGRPATMGTPARSAPPPAAAFTAASPLPQQITALLFADAVGFSKLAEEEIPSFVRQFLGKIAVLLATSFDAPALRATWGDGLYFVFESVESAGRLALDLKDLIANTDWIAAGLSSQLELRIALHAGPTYRCVDPVSGQANYTGSHVSRAARIEPITPPNQVYASQAFVALAAADQVEAFEWDYVGVVPLAKNYGTAPMYHLRRSTKRA